MSYRTASNYNKVSKVWSGEEERSYFATDLSIGEIIFHEMQRHPKDVAQISDTEHTVLTREELLLNAMRVATYMRQLGLQQKDIVGIMARNTTHISAVAYACFFNGIPFHSLNVAYEQKTINKLYNITKPKLMFCDGDEYKKIYDATKNLNVKIITMRNHREGVMSIVDVLATPVQAADFLPMRLQEGNKQILCILCSSGTTGTPKAVTIVNSFKAFNWISLNTNDVQYSHSSLDWITGLLTLITTAIYSTKRIIADNVFDPAHFVQLIEKYKISFVMHPPSQLAMFVNCAEFQEANLDSIRSYIIGGGHSSLEVNQAIRNHLNNGTLGPFYGFTELGGICTMNTDSAKKPASVGRLLAGYQMKIISEDGAALGPNELGEVCMYNGQFWPGYYNNPAESQSIRDEQLWFHTGDIGYVDEDGYLYIVDRKKEMLKYQNIMYYPNEIEEVINKMPQVADVCVFGIWNDLVGDAAAAAVLKKLGTELTAQDVVDYVEQHVKAKYKQLNAGAIIVDEILRLPNGKTNRRANKEHFLKCKSLVE